MTSSWERFEELIKAEMRKVYSKTTVDHAMNPRNIGGIEDADGMAKVTGPCGDTMKIYLRLKDGRIKDAKIQVLGCPGAVASAMAAMDLVRGKTIEDAAAIKDRDIFRMLEEIPDQKQHCIRLTIKTLKKAIEEYQCKKENHPKGE